MPKLVIVNREGEETTVEAESGISVMENIRDNGFDELLALCGGSCSCATCHVFVDEAWTGKVGGPSSEDESDLLDSSDYRRTESRLSCQIDMADDLDGLKVEIAPED